MKDYTPVEQGGYREGMSVQEKYNTWAAAQYKEKVSPLLNRSNSN
jgi:ADP-ribosylation factor GTPase-activating protein 1